MTLTQIPFLAMNFLFIFGIHIVHGIAQFVVVEWLVLEHGLKQFSVIGKIVVGYVAFHFLAMSWRVLQ